MTVAQIQESEMTHDPCPNHKHALAHRADMAATILVLRPALADDQIKLTIGQRHRDTAIAHLGARPAFSRSTA